MPVINIQLSILSYFNHKLCVDVCSKNILLIINPNIGAVFHIINFKKIEKHFSS